MIPFHYVAVAGSRVYEYSGGHLLNRRITAITTYEMRIWEESIARSLRGDWFKATQAEIDQALNEIRHSLKDRGIKIIPEVKDIDIPFLDAVRRPLPENQIEAVFS
jgi:hypothetical protein